MFRLDMEQLSPTKCKIHLELLQPLVQKITTHICRKCKTSSSFIRNGKSSFSLLLRNHHQQTTDEKYTNTHNNNTPKWIEISRMWAEEKESKNKQIHFLTLLFSRFSKLFLPGSSAFVCECEIFVQILHTELYLPPKPTTTPAPYIFTTAKPRRKHNHGKNHHENGNKAKGESHGLNQLQRGEFDPNLALSNEGERWTIHEIFCEISCHSFPSSSMSAKAKLWRAMNYYDFCWDSSQSARKVKTFLVA